MQMKLIFIFWALNNIQNKHGKSVYFRLSTKKLTQPNRISNSLKNSLVREVIGSRGNTKMLIFYLFAPE